MPDMTANKTLKKVPMFASEKEEADFWDNNDSSEYDLGEEIEFDTSHAKMTTDLSMRIPILLDNRMKREAEEKGISYSKYLLNIFNMRPRKIPFLSSEKMKSVRFFATTRHCHKQNDMHGPLPYTHHLEAVQNVLLRFDIIEEELLMSAWLHDIVEDTGTKLKEIREMFGNRVHDLVWAVTDEPGETRKVRKAMTYPKMRTVEGAVTLKLADRIANVETGGSMGDTYKQEYEDFRRALYTAGSDEEMWHHLDSLIK